MGECLGEDAIEINEVEGRLVETYMLWFKGDVPLVLVDALIIPPEGTRQ